MLSDRALPFRRWIELVAWLGLGGLFVVLQYLPLPDSQRLALAFFLLVLGLYLFVCFYILFPHSHYAPRVIYATLVVDVFVIGVLRLFLADYLPNLELAFIPLIVIAALVADRPGVLAIAAFAALVDFVPQLRILAIPRDSSSLLALVNQGMVAISFALTGLVVLYLVETVRGRIAESSSAVRIAADRERQQRQAAEQSARRWELVNAIGLQIQAETDRRQIFRVVGQELQRLELNSVVATWAEPEKLLQVEYVSLPPALYSQLEQVLGLTADTARLSIDRMPQVQQALTERRALYFTSNLEFVRQYLPPVPDDVVARVMELIKPSKYIIVPLFVEDRALGLFGLWGTELDAWDAPVITGLAQQIAVALEKALLLEREQKRSAQLALVAEIAEKAVDLIDADELYSEVTRLIVQRFGYENASVFINDPARREVVLRAHSGSAINRQEIGYRQTWERGLIGTAARTGKTALANDVRQDPRYLTWSPEHDLCRAEMSVPLKRGDEILGVLDVQSTVPNVFEPADVAAMEALASQIAAALEKRELFASERKRAAQLALVSAIAERITAILDSGRLLAEVVTLIRERFGYYNVTILEFDETAPELCLRAVSGGYTDLFPGGYRQPLAVGLIGTAARTGTTVVVNDVRQDARFYFPTERPTKTGSEMSIPLKMGSQTLGVLDIQTTNINAFDASDVAAMETLANQIAIALENARLYAQTKGEAEVKAALLRELSHRVKNNLATIVGLLYLGLDDETIPRAEILNEALTRVQSMAVAHTLLANSPHARVDVVELSRHILRDSVRLMTLPGRQLPFVVEGDAIEISAHRAASLALILNELVTNAIKHSGGEPAAELRLRVTRAPGQTRLEFFNPGESLPDELFPSNRPGGLGLHLIRTLVEKDLGGTFSLSSSSHPRGVLGVICFAPEKES